MNEYDMGRVGNVVLHPEKNLGLISGVANLGGRSTPCVKNQTSRCRLDISPIAGLKDLSLWEYPGVLKALITMD